MSMEIVNKIEALPPLPKTIHELTEFNSKVSKEADELLSIIEKDALIIATLLKISNSAMFGFRSKVESPGRAINLLGVDFTLNVAISSVVNNLIKTDLKPYGVSNDDFMNSSTLSTSLVNIWVSQIDNDLKNELILPALLQNAGKFVISDIVMNQEQSDEFYEKLHQGESIKDVEKEFLGYSTSEVTAMIFKHWRLSEPLIELIKNVDSPENCDKEILKKAQILNVIKTACSLVDNLSEENIERAVKKAKEYNLDSELLRSSIAKLQQRIEDAL